jgi:hypothetical protein
MEGRSVFRFILIGLCLFVTAMGLNNVYGDNGDVVALAQKAACGKDNCSYTTLRQERSPVKQSFTFQTHLTEKGAREKSWSVDVDCRRDMLLIGDYKCTALNAPPTSVQ